MPPFYWPQCIATHQRMSEGTDAVRFPLFSPSSLKMAYALAALMLEAQVIF
jgi:hypothetical protein